MKAYLVTADRSQSYGTNEVYLVGIFLTEAEADKAITNITKKYDKVSINTDEIELNHTYPLADYFADTDSDAHLLAMYEE